MRDHHVLQKSSMLDWKVDVHVLCAWIHLMAHGNHYMIRAIVLLKKVDACKASTSRVLLQLRTKSCNDINIGRPVCLMTQLFAVVQTVCHSENWIIIKVEGGYILQAGVVLG